MNSAIFKESLSGLPSEADQAAQIHSSRWGLDLLPAGKHVRSVRKFYSDIRANRWGCKVVRNIY